LTNSTRQIVHLTYSGWPDGGVPSSTLSIRKLARLFLWFQEQSGVSAPGVVHCLAGISRSTCFIALLTVIQSSIFSNLLHFPDFRDYINEIKRLKNDTDYLLSNYIGNLDHVIEETLIKHISISDIVAEIRRQRNKSCIQWIEQYVFIYQVLKEELRDPLSISHILSELEAPVLPETAILNCDNFDLSDTILQRYCF